MRTTHVYRAIFLLGAALLIAAPVRVSAQNFDTSGTAGLTGPYLFRYVNFFNDEFGNLTESCSLTGTITFDGSGTYKLSNTKIFDSQGVSNTGSCTSLGGGTYGVQSNGIAQLDNPIYGVTLFGTFSAPVLTASSTEDDGFDLFIAVQAPSASSSTGLLSGTFTVGTLDFLNSSAALARQGYFTMKADGHGNIAPFTVNGSLANVSSGDSITQNVSASHYSLSGAAGGTLTFPGTSADQKSIVSGPKALYVSSDGNWFVAGSESGSDMFFGFRAPSGTSSNSTLNGTYFTAGMEAGIGTDGNFLDAFYGSISTNGNGNLITHERFDDIIDISTFDNTFSIPVTIGADGSYYDGNFYTYLAGANGTALMQIGSNEQFSMIVGIHAPGFAPASLWINPVAITDAANYTPITNAYAPGELVNLYGNFGVSTQVAPSLPFSTTLNGVQVLVNGQAAPLYLVSKNQISALIPYEVAGEYFATFQVAVNGSTSNQVTVYIDNTAPGIYTLTQDGMGEAAILHANQTPVSDSNPAKPDETVIMFMNGLGPVTPQVADGTAAPSSPVSNSLEASDIFVFLDDGQNFSVAPVSFAGLAPGFAGLYQVNFTLPHDGVANGDVFVAFATIEAENEMATISVSGYSSDDARRAVPGRRGRRAIRAHARPAKNFRRALPDRPKP